MTKDTQYHITITALKLKKGIDHYLKKFYDPSCAFYLFAVYWDAKGNLLDIFPKQVADAEAQQLKLAADNIRQANAINNSIFIDCTTVNALYMMQILVELDDELAQVLENFKLLITATLDQVADVEKYASAITKKLHQQGNRLVLF